MSEGQPDLLGYRSIAATVADAIRKGPRPDGFVVGITGPWGIGKTRLLSYIREELRPNAEASLDVLDAMAGTPMECPSFVLVEFSPWWFSGRHDLAVAFFDQLASKIQASRHVGRRLRRWLDQLGVSVGAAPVRFTARFGLGRTQSRDVAGLKKSITKSLRKLRGHQTIVIFIDDVDRLPPNEVEQLFGLVRGVADFPNTVYLLALDVHQVSRSIALAAGIQDREEAIRHGNSYLEKIIQARVDLPIPDETVLLRELDRIVRSIVTDSDPHLFIEDEWERLLAQYLSKVVSTPRDLIRIADALELTYPRVRDYVNVVDFIALEVIRLFAPAAHQLIQEHRDEIVPAFSLVLGRAKSVEEILKDAWPADSRRAGLARLAKHVFPEPSRDARRDGYERRARYGPLFRVYFTLSPSPGHADRADVRQLIAASENGAHELHQLMVGMVERQTDDRARYLETLFGEFSHWLATEHVLITAAPDNALRAIVWLSDDCDEAVIPFHLLGFDALRRLPRETVAKRLTELFEEKRGVVLLCDLLRWALDDGLLRVDEDRRSQLEERAQMAIREVVETSPERVFWGEETLSRVAWWLQREREHGEFGVRWIDRIAKEPGLVEEMISRLESSRPLGEGRYALSWLAKPEIDALVRAARLASAAGDLDGTRFERLIRSVEDQSEIGGDGLGIVPRND